MQYMKLDAVSRDELLRELGAMPGYLRSTFDSLPESMLASRGTNGAFSPLEQVWHLADLEVEGFGARIDRLLNEDAPHLPDFDGDAIARQRNYRARPLADGLRRFEHARRANIEKLRSMPSEAWTRSGTQEGVGAVSLCDMPVFLRQHDEAHRNEIEEWKGRTTCD